MSGASLAERRGLPWRPASAGGGGCRGRAAPEGRWPLQARVAGDVAAAMVAEVRAEVRSTVVTTVVQEVAAEMQRSLSTMSQSLVARFQRDLREEGAKIREGFAQVGEALVCQSTEQLVQLNHSICKSIEDCTVGIDSTQLAEAVAKCHNHEEMSAVKAQLLSKFDHLDELFSRIEAFAEGSEQLREQMTSFCQQSWEFSAELDASIRRSMEDCKVQVDCSQMLDAISTIASALPPTPGGSGQAEVVEENADWSPAQWTNHSSRTAADRTSSFDGMQHGVGGMAKQLEVMLEQNYFALLMEIRKMSQGSAVAEQQFPEGLDRWTRFARLVRSAAVANRSGTGAA
ncbi:unnamed protein product [Prorocentrum cordatum]|uniref:Uncharacterized protein n=2 Tax=Prorocentrum cordatum TaxID=2364126 RepID=A0ABN9THX0_9DINO|nr:unnamed protein product [Polarella glacialis]